MKHLLRKLYLLTLYVYYSDDVSICSRNPKHSKLSSFLSYFFVKSGFLSVAYLLSVANLA